LNTGHEGTGTGRTVYNKGFPLAALRDVIAKVERLEIQLSAEA